MTVLKTMFQMYLHLSLKESIVLAIEIYIKPSQTSTADSTFTKFLKVLTTVTRWVSCIEISNLIM